MMGKMEIKGAKERRKEEDERRPKRDKEEEEKKRKKGKKMVKKKLAAGERLFPFLLFLFLPPSLLHGVSDQTDTNKNQTGQAGEAV